MELSLLVEVAKKAPPSFLVSRIGDLLWGLNCDIRIAKCWSLSLSIPYSNSCGCLKFEKEGRINLESFFLILFMRCYFFVVCVCVVLVEKEKKTFSVFFLFITPVLGSYKNIIINSPGALSACIPYTYIIYCAFHNSL